MVFLFRSLSIIVLGSIAFSSAKATSNNDVVVMKNGDRLTGEVKKLENGFLYLKVDYMVDTAQLDWKLVERVESKEQFIVLLTDGTRSTGIIENAPELDPRGKGFTVRSEASSTRARNADVVNMTPVEENFWQQLAGSANYGLSFTGGTSTLQSNFSGDVAYRAERWAAKLEGSHTLNRENGAKSSGRNTLNTYYYKYRGERWFVAGTASLLNSLQQDLTARTTIGLGIGLDLVRRSTSSLQVLGGALFSNEQYSPAAGSKSDRGADSQFLVQYSQYLFTKFQFITKAGAFPSLTTPGRVRMSIESSLKREIVKDLNLVFSVYENYDSRPPVVAPKNDFGTTTSIGWTF